MAAEYVPVYAGRAVPSWVSEEVTAGQLVESSGAGVRPASAGSTNVVGVAGMSVGPDVDFGVIPDSLITVHTGGTQRLLAGVGGITAGDVVAAGDDGTVVAIGGGAFATQIGIARTTGAEGTRVDIQMDR